MNILYNRKIQQSNNISNPRNQINEPNNLVKIGSNNNEISIFQIIGLILMIGSTFWLFFKMAFSSVDISPARLSLGFFFIMLGYAMAYPEMLVDHTKGLSTRRIVVFMMSLVVCMLFLKVGFGEEMGSFEKLKLDWSWLGLIAFIFGAKAAQSYFESQLFSRGIPSTGVIEEKYLWEALDEDQQKTLINDCISQNEELWFKQFDNISGVGSGIKVKDRNFTNKNAIVFHVPEKKDIVDITKKIPERIYFRNFAIPTDVIESNEANSSSYIKPESIYSGFDDTPRKLGAGISRIEQKINTGSIGLIVKRTDITDDKKYILSCFHVLFPDHLSSKEHIGVEITDNVQFSEICSPSNEDTSSDEKNIIVGKAFRGIFNKYLDCGIAEIQNETVVDKFIDSSIPKAQYSLKNIDEKIQTSVKMFGRTSRWQYGRIISTQVTKSIRYNKNLTRVFSNLIQTTRISAAGDSGACVMLRNTNRVIGIIVATDEVHGYSYILPINRILLALKITY